MKNKNILLDVKLTAIGSRESGSNKLKIANISNCFKEKINSNGKGKNHRGTET